jgi:hypothetical protein
MRDERVAIQVEGGLIVAYPPRGDEFGVLVEPRVFFLPFQSMSAQSLLHRLSQFFLSLYIARQKISNDYIFGFLNSRGGIIGFGGSPHWGLDVNEGGFLVKFYKDKESGSWKSKHILETKYNISYLEESNNGLLLLTKSRGKYRYIPYSWSDLAIDNYFKDNPVYSPGDIQNIISTQLSEVVCPYCNKMIKNRDYLVKCGPCGKLFCPSCWHDHQWSHGKAPAIGIIYYSSGSFSGYDGGELTQYD